MATASDVNRSVHIADISIHDETVDFRLSESGVPILVFSHPVNDLSQINLPDFWMLDELCSEQTFAKYGQAFLITDLLVREGMCTYKNGAEFRNRIKHNLRNNTFIAAFH